MFIKIHKSYRYVVAICDSKLIGKKFYKDKFQLDVKESFFKGEKISKKEIINIMKDLSTEDATFNIIGEESVECAIEAGIISKKGVNKIDGVPFTLVLM